MNDKGDIPTMQVTKAPMGTIIYGAKSKGEDTARLVKEAIQIGFRHIATVSFVTTISVAPRHVHAYIIVMFPDRYYSSIHNFREASILNTTKQASGKVGKKAVYHEMSFIFKHFFFPNQLTIMGHKTAILKVYARHHLV